MALLDRLSDFKRYGQIDQAVIDRVFIVRERLKAYWLADVETPQVEMLLLHLACSLARIKRGGCVSHLYQEFYAEIQSAAEFPLILAIHQDLLHLLPCSAPAAEQSYYLANIYSLVLDQYETLRKICHTEKLMITPIS